jgi:hypothetical protein
VQVLDHGIGIVAEAHEYHADHRAGAAASAHAVNGDTRPAFEVRDDVVGRPLDQVAFALGFGRRFAAHLIL